MATHPFAFRSVASPALAAAALLAAGLALAQPAPHSPLTPPANGPRHADPTFHAFVGATLHAAPGRTLENATLVIRHGRIVSVEAPPRGADGPANAQASEPPAPPPGARVWKCEGLHIYPGFIDPFVEVDAPAPDPTAPGAHWSAKVTPQRSALDGTGPDAETAEALRRLGFAAAAISPRSGIFRGTAAVVSLARREQSSADPPPVYRDRAYHTIALETAGFGGSRNEVERWPNYPNSQMGAIALIRQTFVDADWQAQLAASGGRRGAGQDGVQYLNGATPAAPNCLDALARTDIPCLFVADDELESLRVAKIAREFGRTAIVMGSGLEFRRLDAIVADGLPHIIPLNFPEAPDVSTLAKADSVDLRELMTWEQAPTNPRRLDEAGLRLALTTARLRNRADFRGNLDKAIDHGLDPGHALAMLTTAPAELLGVADRLGAIEPGKAANLVIADGPLFKAPDTKRPTPGMNEANPADEPAPEAPAADQPGEPAPQGAPDDDNSADDGSGEADRDDERARILDVWIDGLRHEINPAPPPDLAGEWTVTLDPPIPDPVTFEIEEGNRITIRSGEAEARARNVSLQDNRLAFTFDHAPFGDPGAFFLSALVEGKGERMVMHGRGQRSDGRWFTWTARRAEPEAPEADRAEGADRRDRGDRTARGRRPDAGPVGRWRLTELDGAPLDPDDPDRGLTIQIDRRRITLTFKRPDEPLVITSDDVAIEGHRVRFTHPLEPLGMPGISTDVCTVEGDTLTGEGTLPDGTKHTYKATRLPDEAELAGQWRFTMIGGRAQPAEPASILTITAGGGVLLTREFQNWRPVEATVADGQVRYTVDMAEIGGQGLVHVRGRPDGDTLRGTMTIPDGTELPWEAVRLTDDQAAELRKRVPETYGYPFGPYALERLPPQEPVLFVNATLWTCGPDGVIENGWIFIKDGQIDSIGRGGPPGTAGEVRVVDLAGQHVTPGLIDCHSHTGISGGVNESGQAITAEVRIGDVTNPDSINWYRQLAGGVTTVNSLHGSANAIGGQNQVNKIRWGVPHPDQMHFEGAWPGIKFALGENPRQANWGIDNPTRYPQTRMGVESLIRDRFTAAREYLEANRSGSSSLPPRRDLELEAIAEILAGERLVHCHSYRQDEILMLCRLAQEFGFRIGTFQHVLEGYKVADEIAQVARGASCFTDWWAYKVEVQDAIPQNGPIMHEQGLVVSFNSDSDELARRLNWEAAKAVKYGGLPPEEALKFVTINPAIQLAIDDRVGSLEVGKDADLAIWSGPPLSSFSRCVATYVDGRCYFSLEQDAAHRKRIASERQRLIQKILAQGESGGSRGGGRGIPVDEAWAERAEREYLDLLDRGLDPEANRPGECGCGVLHMGH